MCTEASSLLRLRVDASADPGALNCVLEPFQNRNIQPRQEQLTLVAAKISRAYSIF
jgi:hypothetical protein